MKTLYKTKSDQARLVLAVFLLTFMICSLMCSSVVFSSDAPGGDSGAANEIGSAVSTSLKDMYGIATKIAIPVAIVTIVWAGFVLLGGGDRAPEKAKGIAIRGAIGLAIIFLAPLIIQGVKGIIEGYGTNNWPE